MSFSRKFLLLSFLLLFAQNTRPMAGPEIVIPESSSITKLGISYACNLSSLPMLAIIGIPTSIACSTASLTSNIIGGVSYAVGEKLNISLPEQIKNSERIQFCCLAALAGGAYITTGGASILLTGLCQGAGMEMLRNLAHKALESSKAHLEDKKEEALKDVKDEHLKSTLKKSMLSGIGLILTPYAIVAGGLLVPALATYALSSGIAASAVSTISKSAIINTIAQSAIYEAAYRGTNSLVTKVRSFFS